MLAGGPLAADLGEPGGEHDQRGDALCGAFAGDLDDRRGGDGDDGELDVAGDVGDARVGRTDWTASPRVDRVDEPAKPGVEQVVEDFAADRAGAARGADHRDRRGPQQVPDGRDGGEPVALLEALDRRRPRARSATRPGSRRAAAASRPGSRFAEDLDHPVVLGSTSAVNVSIPSACATSAGGRADRAEALSLHLVGDREGDLGRRVRLHVDRRGRPAAPRRRGRRPARSGSCSRRRPSARGALEVACGEKKRKARDSWPRPSKARAGLLVLRPHRPQVDGRAVAKDDVGLAMGGIGGLHRVRE